ncbi:hypothetical protein [Actinomadura hibisca]|uniref:hypothetical protein n=1 Tax=Actinomadura hibisca TaxID=68565 RepID=UPI00082CEE08|nr:hypothetical protein [Actinomadura hibisca]
MTERTPQDEAQALQDQMGDDEQEFAIAETERYVEDPPDDMVIGEPEEGPLEISEYERETARRGDPAPDDRPQDDRPAEADAMHELPRRERRMDDYDL